MGRIMHTRFHMRSRSTGDAMSATDTIGGAVSTREASAVAAPGMTVGEPPISADDIVFRVEPLSGNRDGAVPLAALATGRVRPGRTSAPAGGP